MNIPIIEGQPADLFKAIERLGLRAIDLEYNSMKIDVRQFERKSSGSHSVVAVFVGPVAKLTIPLLEKLGDRGGCCTDVLTMKTVEIFLLNGRLHTIDTKWDDLGFHIILPEGERVISKLDELRASRAEIIASLRKIDNEILAQGGQL